MVGVAEITVDFVFQAIGQDGGRESWWTRRPRRDGDDRLASTGHLQEITRCFQDRCLGLEEALSTWNIVKLVVLRKSDAEPKR